jgi:hypothetical protein
MYVDPALLICYTSGMKEYSKYDADKARRKQYYQGDKAQGMEYKSASLIRDHYAYGSKYLRNMWAEDGTPRTVGKSMPTAYRNGRKHAHPAFTERNGRVKVVDLV